MHHVGIPVVMTTQGVGQRPPCRDIRSKTRMLNYLSRRSLNKGFKIAPASDRQNVDK